MKIPAAEYPRPTVKEILDFGASAPTVKLFEDFASRFGYFRREVVDSGFNGRLLWSGEDEDASFQLAIWKDIAFAQAMYGQIQGLPSGKITGWSASGGVPAFCLTYGAGDDGAEFTGTMSMSYGSEDDDIRGFAEDGNTMFFIQGIAAKFIARKLDENSPRLRYRRERFDIVEYRQKETLLSFIWKVFADLLSGKIEARQCSECGEWEVKGDGYHRNTWVYHLKCGNTKRSNKHRMKWEGKN